MTYKKIKTSLGHFCTHFSWPAAFALIAISFGTIVQAADSKISTDDGYTEVSYDDLVNQLHQKKSAVSNSAIDPFDSLQIHAGFGLISSANIVKVNSNNSTKFQNGFQLSLGIDLFSPNWATEGVVRNFGQVESGTETRSLREFDLKFMNRDRILNGAGYRLGAGIGSRYLKVNDEVNSVAIEENTPTALFFGGVEVFATKNLSFGMETAFRSSMVSRSADKNALDITLRLDTYF